MQYVDDRWNVQISPITLVQYNESNWYDDKIPIESKLQLPKNVTLDDVTLDDNKYNGRSVVQWSEPKRKEVKIKDKYLKVKIRYKGDKLSLISGINTNISQL